MYILIPKTFKCFHVKSNAKMAPCKTFDLHISYADSICEKNRLLVQK